LLDKKDHQVGVFSLTCLFQFIKTNLLRDHDFDWTLFEEVFMFAVGEDGMLATDDGARQYCVSVEQPDLTLAGVVEGMLNNEECQRLPEVRQRYADKIFAVLRLVAKALRYLHERGIVHGDLQLSNCCKFANKWKLSGVLNMQKVGERLSSKHRLSPSIPPECLEPRNKSSQSFEEIVRPEAEARPSMDSWAFGKLAYEVLVGEQLFDFQSDDTQQHHEVWTRILDWNDRKVFEVRSKLQSSGVSSAARDLIAQCLAPCPDDRPVIAEILKQLRRLKEDYRDD